MYIYPPPNIYNIKINDNSMDNFKIISQALSQNNADINNLDIQIGKINSSKENSFIILNTDAFSGLTFGNETTIDLEQDIVLSLFNTSSASAFYSQIRNYDNKTFVLKPTNNSFTVGGIDYVITTCSPCVGKIHDYGNIPVLCLTFLVDTINSKTALFRFFVLGISNNEISANLSVENFDEIHSQLSKFIDAKYTKPTDGIPKTDLDATVQASLDKADACDAAIPEINNTLEQKQDKRKISILFIGNSLTQDGIAYLPYMLKTYYPEIDFNIYMWYIGGYTLAQHYSVFTSNGKANIFSVAENTGTWTNYNKSMTMASVLSTYKFDIVSMQEYFNYKTEYEEVTDWNNCRNYIISNYKGGNALEFVSLFHAPLRASADTVFDRTSEGNALILQTTISQDMIPNGIAVYRALDTDLDVLGDKSHLSPDGTHTQEGLPCLMQTYVTLCWLFDRFGINKSVYGHPMRMTKAIYDTISVPGANLGTGVITGTDAQNLLAQEIAIKAYKEGKQFTCRNIFPYVDKVIQCTFTITTNVENAIIKINGVEMSSTTVMAGSTVYWEVSADNYAPQSGNEVVSINTTKYIDLMPVVEVASVSVDFEQGDMTIFNEQTKDDIRNLITVKALYENGVEAEVSDYTLTGDLTEGVCTFYVSYGGQSATFDVNVTKVIIPETYNRYGFIEYYDTKLGPLYPTSKFIYLPAYDDYNSLSMEVTMGQKSNVSKLSSPGILGARLGTGTGYPYYAVYVNSTEVKFMLRDVSVSVPVPASLSKFNVKINNQSTSPANVQINNGTPTEVIWAGSPRTLNVGMSLFNNIPNGTSDGMYINYSARIGDIIFRNANGTCVGYFTPVTQNGIIGMYDQISQTFYTATDTTVVDSTASTSLYSVGNW